MKNTNQAAAVSEEAKKLQRTKTTLKSQAKRYILNFCEGEEFQELFDGFKNDSSKTTTKKIMTKNIV